MLGYLKSSKNCNVFKNFVKPVCISGHTGKLALNSGLQLINRSTNVLHIPCTVITQKSFMGSRIAVKQANFTKKLKSATPVLQYLRSTQFLHMMAQKREALKNKGKIADIFRMGDLVRVSFVEHFVVVKFTGVVCLIKGSGIHEIAWVFDPIEKITQGFYINTPGVLRVEIVQRNYQKVDRNLTALIRPPKFRQKEEDIDLTATL